MTPFDAHRHLPAPPEGGAFLCAVDERDFAPVLAAAAADPRIVPFLGIHPWRADRLTPDPLARLESLLVAHPRAGVGEIGLDRSKVEPDFATQQAAFSAQLALAVRLRRPLQLHAVRAADALLAAFKEAGAAGLPAVVHGFRGGPLLARQLTDAGFLLSFPPALLDPAESALRDAVRATPDDRLLLETDAPNRWGGLAPALGMAEPPGPETLLSMMLHDVAAMRRTTPERLTELLERNIARFAI